VETYLSTVTTQTAGSINGVVVSNTMVYAFTWWSQDTWYAASPRIWRISRSDFLSGDPTNWIVLSEDDSPQPTGEVDRDTHYLRRNNWMDDQVLRSNWASSSDAVFFANYGTPVGNGAVQIWQYTNVSAPMDGRHTSAYDERKQA
jgi:hypothetical protein